MVGFRWVSSLVFVVGVVACSGSSSSSGSGSTTITGTISGTTIPTTSTVATIEPLVDTFGAFTTNGVAVLVSNLDDLCATEQRGANPPNMTRLLIIASSPATVLPGTYAITGMASATANFGALGYETSNAQCATTSTHPAQSGSVILSTVSSTLVEGTFDVTMETGDHLSGTFAAPVCEAPDGGITEMACGM